jgi:hypothetical protein
VNGKGLFAFLRLMRNPKDDLMSYLAILKKADEERKRQSEAEGVRPEATDPSGLQSAEPLRLGRLNDRGQLVLTLEDMPRLEEKLREQGWIVKRVGDELDCQPRRPWSRVQ